MKNASKEELNETRPVIDTKEAVDFCLNRLYKDKKHNTTDEVVKGLTFEELIGALLLAKDLAKEHPDDETVIDIDKLDWEAIQNAAAESSWIPKEYMQNDWVSDVKRFLKEGK